VSVVRLSFGGGVVEGLEWDKKIDADRRRAVACCVQCLRQKQKEERRRKRKRTNERRENGLTHVRYRRHDSSITL